MEMRDCSLPPESCKSRKGEDLGVAIGLLTVGFGVPAILAAFLPPRGDWFLRFARGWARCVLAVSGVEIRVLHADRLPRSGSFVVAANHESFADIAVLLAALPLRVRFLAKRSIFRVPVLGWSIAAAGFIPVDRGDRSGSASTVDSALERLRRGLSLVIFPEETRTRTGELSPFKHGAALLALRAKLPILPVGLAGTRRVLPRGALCMTGGPVAICPGEPIATDGASAGDRRKVTETLRERIESLRREARESIR
jgi:1-acyl-sn-glycerol-3-phosphate acyltransferase